MAVFGPPILVKTGIAGATLTSKKGYIVELQSDGKWDLSGTDGGTIALQGVLLSDNKADGAIVDTDPILVGLIGIFEVIADAGIAVAQPICPGATDGTVKTAVTTTWIIGRALTGTSTQNAHIIAAIDTPNATLYNTHTS